MTLDLDFSLKPRSVCSALGENVNEFFFRLASLAFESSVLAELEKSGSRQIGEVISEYSSQSPAPCITLASFKRQPVVCLELNNSSNNLDTSSNKKKCKCCQ